MEKCGVKETGKQRGQEYQEKKTSGKTNLNLASLLKIEKKGLPEKLAQVSRKKNCK